MKKNTPFFPETLRFFLRDILQKFFGVIIFLLGIFLLDSLISFKESHISWNTASSIVSCDKNFFLSMMNYLADIILQVFGLSAVIFSIILTTWGFLWCFYGKNFFQSFRLACFPFLIISFSIAFSGLPEHKASFAWGGILGSWLFDIIYNYNLFNRWIICIIFWIISFPLFFFVLGLPILNWKNFFCLVFNNLKKIFNQKFPIENDKKSHISKIPIETFSTKDSFIKTSTLQLHNTIVRTDHVDYISPDPKLLISGEGLNRHHNNNNEVISPELLLKTLKDFGVQGLIHKMSAGPVVTLYEFEPAPGVKASRIINLASDLARGIGALSVRIGVIPGKKVLGIELSNKNRSFVRFHDVLISSIKKITVCKLPLILGVDISGMPEVVDLATMPHLLMAGTTGSGKSVGLNTMILSLIFFLSPQQCRFIMIDPKMLELSVYHDIPHLLTPVVTDPKKAAAALQWAVRQMEDRYARMSEFSVRNIENFNKKAKMDGKFLLPYIVIIIDEMADLMMVAGKEIEIHVQRLAQMARAAGIHLITATQRPSVDVITGTIKSNFAHRISFKVTSKIDSRTILGEIGAEQLLGKGDMLYLSGCGDMKRIHGPFVEDMEIESVCNDLRNRYSVEYESSIIKSLEYSIEDSDESDQLLEEAIALVIAEGRASTSFLQRHFKIGYNRAARLMESMERQGIVSRADNVGRRQVLIESKRNNV